MKYPNCPNSALVMTDLQCVAANSCPDCRVVWLDRGELVGSDPCGVRGRRNSWLSDSFD